MFIVTVRFTIHTGHEADFLAAVRTQSRNSLTKEPDCKQFDVCVSADRPNEVFLYEAYASPAAFDSHVKTPHFANFSAVTQAWIEQKTVDTWTLNEA